MATLQELPSEIREEIEKRLDAYESTALAATSKFFGYAALPDEPLRISYPALWKICCLLFRNARLKQKPDDFVWDFCGKKRLALKSLDANKVNELMQAPYGDKTMREAFYGTAQSISVNIEFCIQGSFGVERGIRLQSNGDRRCVTVEHIWRAREGMSFKLMREVCETESPQECLRAIVRIAQEIGTLVPIAEVKIDVTEHPNKAVSFAKDYIGCFVRSPNAATICCNARRGPNGRVLQKFESIQSLWKPLSRGLGVHIAIPANDSLVKRTAREMLEIVDPIVN